MCERVIRLRGLNPFYLAAFLKSRLGRAQVSRFANGVGVPNISFDEIRALMVPRLPPERQRMVERAYRRDVLPVHRKAVARHRWLHAGSQASCAAAACRTDPRLKGLREVGERRWQAIIRCLDAEVLDPDLQVDIPAL